MNKRHRSKGSYLHINGLPIEWRFQAVNLKRVAREVCLQPGISYQDALLRAARRNIRDSARAEFYAEHDAQFIAMNGARLGHGKIWDYVIGRGPKGGRAYYLYPTEHTITMAFDNALLEAKGR